MGKRIERAFDVMRERNRRYLESRKENGSAEEQKAAAEDSADLSGAELSETKQTEQSGAQLSGADRIGEEPAEPAEQTEQTDPEDLSEEMREAEEKLRAYREKNGLPGSLPGTEPKESARAEPPKLEKGDVPAMIIAAVIVFGPIFLVLIAVLALAWIFLH